MNAYQYEKSIYVDVDGCLIFWPGDKPGVRNEGKPLVNIELVEHLQIWRKETVESDAQLVVWSANGKEHAEMAVKLAGIEDIVDVCLTKPTTLIDDNHGWIDSRKKVKPTRQKKDVEDSKLLKLVESADRKLTVPNDDIVNNIKHSIKLGLPQIKQHDPNTETLCILGGGASLLTTFDELKHEYYSGAKLVAVNGTYNWLLEKNMKPSIMAMVDAQDYTAKYIKEDVPGCRYLFASQCHPSVFEACEGRDIHLWHAINTEEELKIIKDYYMNKFAYTAGGSTVILRLFFILELLGFSKFHLFGFDSCLTDEGQHHAYTQDENYRDAENTRWVTCGNKKFLCTGWHISQAYHFQEVIREFGNKFDLIVHGEGLIAHMIKYGAELQVEEDDK